MPCVVLPASDLGDAAVRGAAVALLALFAAVLLRDRRRQTTAHVGVALALGLCVQVVSSTPAFEAQVLGPWQAPLVGIAVANAVLFWIFVQALFDDRPSVRPVQIAAWGSAAALGWFNCAVQARSGSWASVWSWLWALQRAVPLLFAVLAVVAAAAHWRSDLVEGRRRLRPFIVVTGVFYSLAMLGARLASGDGRLRGVTALIDMSMLVGIVATILAASVRLTDAALFPVRSPSAPDAACDASTLREQRAAALPSPVSSPVSSADDGQDRLAAALDHAMRIEHAYRDDGLTVATLAARLGVPEYRLRALINGRLGHRNFNVFLNGYRIADAQAKLSDPRRRSIAILDIALGAGFGSVGPFNRAFKAATGQTPSDFRRQRSADS